MKANEECSTLREEVDLYKERILQLQKNDAKVEVWKKKYEEMVHVREELSEYKLRVQRLMEEEEVLKNEKEHNR